jgi:hypothetical protein
MTIPRVLDDLGLCFFAPRWIPHRLSDAQKADRVELSQHMLDMMQGSAQNSRNILQLGTSPGFTGTINVAECEHKTEMSCHQIEADDLVKKMMVSAYFSRCDFVSVEFIQMGQKYNSQFFTEAVLPSVEKKLEECRPKLREQQLPFMLTTPNQTPPKCPLKRLKSWASS